MTQARWPSAILFDLDGTLVDSVPDIHAALNETLESYGEPPFTIEAVARMVGRGVPTLIERAYEALDKPLDAATRDRIVDRFLAIYGPRATELTTLNPGATGAVLGLAERSHRLGVVTNKPEAATQKILDHFGLAEAMAIVIGGDAGVPRKPAPDLILLACKKLGIEPSEGLFVGDSQYDVEAARAAGMSVVVLEGGYSARPAGELGADRVVKRLDEIEALLAGLAPGH
ncbi:phosphoglycolate phosphatase [Aureimonas mangrovi]|uniref:phosphoglycolate phosphatase n=1 Tax=Aureimonas mangrovi TaxID=2758041 RepID=UPI00163D4FC1|nr:phosphoglycolate phosphatase [Aureimonas mangrovi]